MINTVNRNEDTVAYAVEKAGGMFALARALGIKYQAIQTWRQIPAKRVADIERITGIAREDLRPDIFGLSTQINVADDRPKCSRSKRKRACPPEYQAEIDRLRKVIATMVDVAVKHNVPNAMAFLQQLHPSDDDCT